jgi:hypothetical protein
MVGAKQFAIMRKIIEDKKENPIVKNIAMPPWMKGEQNFSKPHGNFLDILKSEEKEIKPKKENKKDFSEELINRLTYEVFQNIKNYLDNTPDNSENSLGSKHIKLEISL